MTFKKIDERNMQIVPFPEEADCGYLGTYSPDSPSL
jgi:hypothetical protein